MPTLYELTPLTRALAVRRIFSPRNLLPIGLSLALPCVQAQAQAQAQAQEIEFNIPAQPLIKGLQVLGQQANLQTLYNPEALHGLRGSEVKGKYSPEQAASLLLEGTGVVFNLHNGTLTLKTESSSAVELGATTVTGGAWSTTTEGTGSYAARATTLMKGSQSLKEIPQSITVITRKQMDDQRLDTVDEVLANTPGITLRRRVGGGNDIISRGFETNTIQYDGVPLPRSYTNGNMLSSSSIYLDRIEVLRGAQGLLEGAGSPAGAVNLVRKRGLSESLTNFEGRAGSWDNYGTRLDTGGPLNDDGTVRSRIVIDYEDRNSFIDKVWDQNLNGYSAIDFDLSPDTSLGLGIAYSRLKGNSGLYYGVPRYEDGSALPLPQEANLDADWSASIRRETQIFFDLEHKFNQNWRLKAAGIYVNENYDADTALSYFRLIPVEGSTMTAPGFSYDFGGKSKGADINISGEFNSLGIEHEVVFGGNYSNQNRDDAFDEYSSTTVDISDYKKPIPKLETRPLNRTRDLNSETTQRGVYGIWRGHLTEKATLILGGRTSWYEFENSITNPVTGMIVTSSNEKETGEFTPYGGFVYDLTPDWSLYASYAEIFEPQSTIDASFKVLPPMTGANYETGIKGELYDGRLIASLAIYRAEQKDRAVTDYDSPMVCGGWYCSRAAGKVRSEGVEIEAHGNITDNLQVTAGYTYNHNEYLDDENADLIGSPFSYETPKHSIRIWSDYQLSGDLNKWRVGVGVNYRSKQRTGEDTMLDPVQGGYSIWSARLAYEPDDKWAAALNVDNLFDKNYYSSISQNYLNNYVGDPRSLLLSIKYKL